MSLIPSLGTSQKKEPSGAPFTTGSANNGLSVDTTTGKIVLGNDVGDAAKPAQLLSFREIATGGNEIQLVDTIPATVRAQYFDSYVQLTNLITNATAFMQLNGSSPQIQANALGAGNDANFSISNAAGSSVAGQTNGVQPFVEIGNALEVFHALLIAAVLHIKSNSGVGNGLTLDSAANDVASTGTLSTVQPSASGAGKWKLGKFVAGAVAPDAANYVEVMIDGVIRKLIVAV